MDDGTNVLISLHDAGSESNWVSDEAFDIDMRLAMLSGAIYVAYQPIVDLRNGKLKKLEALARWNHPERGPIGPDVFIPWAERTGVIAELGEWILDRACHDLVKMQAEGIEVDLNVNISVKQLEHADLSHRFSEVFARSRLAPGRVWIEVTESVLLDAGALAPLAALRSLGMRLVIDDFGTGHANYDYLTRLTVDSLKIDTTFVAGLGTRSPASAIVNSVLTLGRELGLEIVAEGVETESQRAQLLELNCRFGQGWLFDRALRYDELVQLYAPDETQPTAVVVEHRSNSDESVRLSALRACRILDTDPEASFDSIVHLAAQLLSAPTAVIALADADRQWFKARVGTDLTEVPRVELCSTILAAHPDEPLVIGDTTQHEHCALTPSVMGVPHARAYAAMPIRSREGLTLGTLSVVDTTSRSFSSRELGQLTMLATQVSELLDLRRRTVELDDLYIGAHHNGRSAGSIPDDLRAHLIDTPGIAALGHLTRVAYRDLAAAPPERATCLRFDELVIDLAVRTINVGGQSIKPPAKEFDLLAFLATRPGEVFTRAELLHHVWNSKPEWQNPSTVTEHIHRLRTRIETDPNRPKLLRTVRGQGYSFQPASLSVTAPDLADARWGSWMYVDDRVVAADDGIVALLGAIGPADLIGRVMSEFVAPASLPAVLAGREMRAAGFEPGPHVLTLRAVDGTERLTLVRTEPGEFDGRPAIVGIAREIVDARRLMRQMVSGVLTEVADAVVVTDPDLHVLSWNPAAARLYGWSEQEAVGFTLPALVGDDTGFYDSAPWGDLELNGGWTGILRQRARDGTLVTVASSVNLIRDGGDVTGIALVNRPVPAALASAKTDGGVAVPAASVPADFRPGSYGPLETSPDAALDALTRLAARLMETPLAAVALIEGDRQWLVSSAGIEMTGMRHDVSFSALAIATPDNVFVVNDTELDERFVDNPFVTGAPFIRSCAAMPIYSREGRLLGTLKVLDIRSRKFTDRQIRLLKVLALQVATLLELRRRADELDELIDEQGPEAPADEQLSFALDELLFEPKSAEHDPRPPAIVDENP